MARRQRGDSEAGEGGKFGRDADEAIARTGQGDDSGRAGHDAGDANVSRRR